MKGSRVREMSWESLAAPLQAVKGPDWKSVEARIAWLKTAESGSVFLNAANRSVLSIGGVDDVGYLVFISDKTGFRYVLAPPEKRKGVATLVIGFQPSELPRRIMVDLDTALRVARAYFNSGGAADDVEWTTDSKTVER